MPRVNCPNCEKVLVVPDRLAGKAGICPSCKGRVEIPPLKPKDDDDEIVDSFVDDDDPPPRRKSKPDQERVSAKRDSRRSRDEEEDEEDDRPVKKKKPVREEDEDDRPARSSSKKGREEYTDEPPRKARSRRDEDEEDEDRPRRRLRDEEDDDRPSPPRRRRRKRRASSGEFSFTSPTMITALSLGGVVLVLSVLALVVPAIAIVPIGLGYLLAFVGGIWFLIVAFQDDVMQGVLCWFVPFYSLYYLVTHFEEEKYPFFTQLAGILLIMVGACAGGTGAGLQSGGR